MSKFQVIGQEEVTEQNQAAAQAQATQQAQATRILLMALATVSKRALAAVADLKGLLTIGSVWWLAMQVSRGPSVNQLIGLALYAATVLTANIIWRR